MILLSIRAEEEEMERPILRMAIMPIVALALACSVIAQAEEIGTERGMKTDIKSESEYQKLEQAMPHFETLENSASLAMPALALDSVSVSSFNILFSYDVSALAAVQVDNLTGGSASFEYFSYQFDADGIQENIHLVGIADLNQDNSHLPLSAGSGQIARLKFSISRNHDFAGFNIPMKFRFLDSLSKDDNTLTNFSGAKIQQEEIAYLEFDIYAGITAQYFHDGNQLRVMIYNLDGNRLPADTENFLTVKNLAEFEIFGRQMASGQGELLEAGYAAVTAAIPESYYLSANYPNPFNPETKISFHLPRTARVELSVYNLLGQRVNTLVEGVLSPGEHFVSWDGRDYQGNNQSSGVYFYRIDSEPGSLYEKWCF